MKKRLLVGSGTAAAALLVGILFLPNVKEAFVDAAEKHEREKQQQAAFEREVVAANRCIADLKQRDPARDADSDIARGDATPIGLAHIQAHDSNRVLQYPQACDRLYDGNIVASGETSSSPNKWLKPYDSSMPVVPLPQEHGQCMASQRVYVERYNRRMVERIPGEIREFCLSQRLDDPGRKWEATKAVVFSDGPRESTEGGWFEETINGHDYLTKPFQLIDQPFGTVLVLISIEANSQSLCPPSGNCADIVSLAYLRADRQQFTMTGRWNGVVRVKRPNSNFQTIGYNANASSKNTELIVMEYGDRSSRETVIELTPDGPVSRGIIEPSD